MIPAINLRSRSDLARSCSAVHRQLSSLADAASSLQERLERLELEFLQLMQPLGLLNSMQAQSVCFGPGPKQLLESRRALREKARQGVESAKIVPQRNGAGVLHLDGKEVVRLSPELTALATVLTDREGKSTDEFVPWRTLPAVRSALGVLTHKEFSKKAVHQLIHRLKKALAEKGAKSFLFLRHVQPSIGLSFCVAAKRAGCDFAGYRKAVAGQFAGLRKSKKGQRIVPGRI